MAKVTVVLPTYNRGYTIKKAIESVRQQSYCNWELIIVDDASTDNTEECVRGYQDTRIKYICNEKNGGAAYSRNEGIRLAQTEYVAFQDSDTVWHPDKLKLQMEKIEREAWDMVYHPYSLNGEIIPVESIPLTEKQGHIYRQLLNCPMVGTPCMLVRKEILEAVGGFCDKLLCLEDYELSLRIARTGSIGFIEDVLLDSMDTEESVSKNTKNEINALFYILENNFEDLEKELLAKKIHFNRICKLAKENDLMQLFYEKLTEYLQKTGQTLDDLDVLYR